MKKNILFIGIIAIIFDQISKLLVVKYLDLYVKKNIINNFFYLTYVKNDGAAWSILKGNMIFLIIITVCALGFIIYNLYKEKNISKLDSISYGLLIGGIIGNFIDRLRLGYVIDFLDFNIFGYNFPVFNIADVMIVFSVIIIVFIVIKGDKNENNSR